MITALLGFLVLLACFLVFGVGQVLLAAGAAEDVGA